MSSVCLNIASLMNLKPPCDALLLCITDKHLDVCAHVCSIIIFTCLPAQSSSSLFVSRGLCLRSSQIQKHGQKDNKQQTDGRTEKVKIQEMDEAGACEFFNLKEIHAWLGNIGVDIQ